MRSTKFLACFFLIIVLLLSDLACQAGAPFAATPTITPTATVTATPTVTPLPANVLTTSNCSAVDVWARIGSGQVNQMLYSPDGSLLLIASAGGMRLYDVKQSKFLWNVAASEGIDKISLDSQKEQILAIDAKNTVDLLDMKSGKLLNSAAQEDHFMALALTEDGQEIAAADFAGVVHRYDTETFDEKGAAIKGPGTAPDATFGDSFYLFMRYSPNKKYIALANLGTYIYVYNVSNGALVNTIKPLGSDYDHRIFPEHLAFSQNGAMLAIDYQDGQTLYTRTTGTPSKHRLAGTSPALSADGSLLALQTPAGVELFQTSTGNSLGLLEGTETAMGSFAFSPDDQQLAVVIAEKTGFWDVKTLKVLNTAATSFTDYGTLALSSDGKTLAASARQSIEFFQTKDGERHTQAWEHPIQFMEFAANDTTLVVAGAKWLSAWDLTQNKMRKEIELNQDIQSMDASVDGQKVAVVGVDNTVSLYDLSSGESQTVSQPAEKFASVTFLNDTYNLLALDDQLNVYVSTAENPELTAWRKASLSLPSASGSLVTFISKIDGIDRVTIYDTSRDKILQDPVSKSAVSAVSSINNVLAIPETLDGNITLSDIHDATKSCKIKDFTVDPKQMLFSPDGQYLFVNARNGIIYVFGIGTQQSQS